MARLEAELPNMDGKYLPETDGEADSVVVGTMPVKKFPIDIQPFLDILSAIGEIPDRFKEAVPDKSGAKIGLFEGLSAVSEQKMHFEQGKVSCGEFLDKNKKELENIVFGGSFSPEKMEEVLRKADGRPKAFSDKDDPYSEYYHNKSLEALKMVVEKYRIHDVRLSIRWEEVTRNGQFDFGYYKDFLDYLLKSKYCMENDVKTCLNLGPVKVSRWKEDFVPKSVLEKLPAIPGPREHVTPKSELGKAGLEHLDTMLKYLIENYKKEELARIGKVQANNEGFNPFGEHEWIMSDEFEKKCLQKIHSYFPDSRLLVNSAGLLQAARIRKLFNELIEEDGTLQGKLVMGINYYYALPPFAHIPVLRNIDTVTVTKIMAFRNLAAENIRASRKDGYEIEITEAQMEPWGNVVSPGNSLHEFQGMVIRCNKTMLDQKIKSVIRLWGLEEMAVKDMNGSLTQDHKDMIDLWGTVNNRASVIV